MAGPLVSVVIPVYNGERFLADAIESALAQDYPRIETVVVDDGSSDRSAEIAASYPVRLLRLPNGGMAHARNAGVAASNGALLAFLDADDVWLEHKVSRQAAALSARPGIGFVLARMQIFLAPGTAPPAWLPEPALREPSKAPIPSALMIRREVFERVGGFDPSYRITCDADWLARAKDIGIDWDLVDDTLLRYRIHATNGSHDREAMSRELAALLHASIRRRRLNAAGRS